MTDAASHRLLFRMMLLSVATAVVTIALKLMAAVVTGSVGFLSDAMESVVNLAAALVGLWAVRLAAQPPDLGHHFGHGKAEYISAAFEGALIFAAAALILWTSIRRMIDPVPLEDTGIGLALSSVAAVLNLVVGVALMRVGHRERSIALVADGRHLLTDVVTSVGVLVGIGLVAVFDWEILDPIVALAVGVHILFTGYGLLQRSVTGLLDAAISPEDTARVRSLLDRYREEGRIDFHELRTRESGRQRFIYMHLLVPDDWTVKRGHQLSQQIAQDIAGALPGTRTFVHIEPIHDPASYDHEFLPAEPGDEDPSEPPEPA